MTEEQIKEEILRYLKDDTYNYAVLIDGEWGSGKTYFVKNNLKSAIVEQEDALKTSRVVKYISLYGCKNISEVQENIAWSFAENAREKLKDRANWDNAKEKFTGNILLSSKKIGSVIMKKLLPEGASLYEIASDWLNLGAFIFVFDDLERCDCPINEVFGFLNELVEHENTKVIIVANEKEILGTPDAEPLELQYQLSLDDRIDWPKPEKNYSLQRTNNKFSISLDEIERRRGLLFPSKEADSDYKKIREKIIGVTLKYEPNVPQVITEIIGKSSCSEDLKKILSDKIEYFKSTMMLYKHRNLRTFQFFLSKVSYLIERLSEFPIESDYYEQIRSHVIEETFNLAVKFKSNFQPPRDSYTWLRTEQKTSLQTVKKYIETGTYDDDEFWQDILNLQTELKAHITADDPYNKLYQFYNLNSQDWCEQNLEELLNRLDNNKYPVTMYGKILIAIQRLIDLGFDECYMDRAKTIMLSNISDMGEVKEIGKDIIWFIDDTEFKKRIQEIISEINTAINNHTEIVSHENVSGILKHEDWVERLKKYVDPNDSGYVDDISVFGKASSSDWLSCLYRASPAEIYLFRDLIYLLYPRNTKRAYYSEDANTIKVIISELKKYEETDLIKKANIKWLIDHLERIIELHEPTMPYREATLTSET